MLVEDQKLDAVVSLPSGVFRPYAGVSTAILLFTKTEFRRHRPRLVLRRARPTAGRLDDKRTPLLPEDKLGPTPPTALDRRTEAREEQPARRAARWQRARRRGAQAARTAQSFCVPKAEIAAAGYDLSHQPLQGGGARGGRAPAAEGDHRGAEGAGGGDRRRAEGVGRRCCD